MIHFTSKTFLVLLCTMGLFYLNGCDRIQPFEEDYCICIINDSSVPISISISSEWEQDLEPYENTGGLNLIYYIPETETITWTRKGTEYSETITIKKLLDGYNKVFGEIDYIIRGDNRIIIKYEVDDKIYFLRDNPEYKQLRDANERLIVAIKSKDIETIKKLIESGISINPQSSLFENPLETAVENSLYDVSEILLKHNAKIEPLYFHGRSALTIACVNGVPLFLVPVVMRVYHTYPSCLEEGGA